MRRYFLLTAAVLAAVTSVAQDALPAPSTKSPGQKKFFYPFEISIKAGVAKYGVPTKGSSLSMEHIRTGNTPSDFYSLVEGTMTDKVSASASVFVSRSVDIGAYYDGSALPYHTRQWPLGTATPTLNLVHWLSRYGMFVRYHYNFRSMDVNIGAGVGDISGYGRYGTNLMAIAGVNYHLTKGLYASLQFSGSRDNLMWKRYESTQRFVWGGSAVAGLSFRF